MSWKRSKALPWSFNNQNLKEIDASKRVGVTLFLSAK